MDTLCEIKQILDKTLYLKMGSFIIYNGDYINNITYFMYPLEKDHMIGYISKQIDNTHITYTWVKVVHD